MCMYVMEPPDAAFAPILAALDAAFLAHRESAAASTRPFVTLTYAQSLDGSIAGEPGKPLRLSGCESMRMTHMLRAWHDSILVGVGTVATDDPSLTVRLCAGDHPLPVVLDPTLRTPPGCKLLTSSSCRRPVIATTLAGVGAAERRAELERAGASILVCESEPDSHRINMADLMPRLAAAHGASRVMVEGGAGVITSLLAHDGRALAAGAPPLLSTLVLTIAPTLVGGVRAVQGLLPPNGALAFPRLAAPVYARAGDDVVVQGTWAVAEGAPSSTEAGRVRATLGGAL